MSLNLYNTLTRQLEPVKPEVDNCLKFYCCGPTVYGPAHIGNFRAFLVQDTLRRVLELNGLETLHVRNLTDVDDKTIKGAQQNNQALCEYTQHWTGLFHEDCKRLNMLAPHVEPKATEHIEEQIDLIKTLIAKEHAYVASDGSVYFKVSSFEDYGSLSSLVLDQNQTQCSNSAGNQNQADEYDRDNIADFALWKAHKQEDGECFWDSPWGKGRPGWHLECSAMALKYLGDHFDLHAGGIDLCFPHHDNEIAQSQSATGKPFARHWMHNEHLMVDGTKMSKSLGNLYTIQDLLDKDVSTQSLRYTLLSGHYRQQLNFTFNSTHASQSALDKISSAARSILERSSVSQSAFTQAINKSMSLEDWGIFTDTWNAINEDLNTPKALGLFFKALKDIAQEKTVSELDATAFAQVLFALGIIPLLEAPKQNIPDEIQELARKRWEAKQNKDFAQSDALRDELLKKHWQVLDKPDGFELKPL